MTLKFRSFVLTAFLVSSIVGVTGFQAFAETNQCRDAKGKFIKCAPLAKPAQCRDEKGKFIKCPTPEVKTQK